MEFVCVRTITSSSTAIATGPPARGGERLLVDVAVQQRMAVR
jgi:hypothetical protein